MKEPHSPGHWTLAGALRLAAGHVIAPAVRAGAAPGRRPVLRGAARVHHSLVPLKDTVSKFFLILLVTQDKTH